MAIQVEWRVASIEFVRGLKSQRLVNFRPRI
jgi:hypothetical protein